MKKLSFILILLTLVQTAWGQVNTQVSSDVVRTIEHPNFTALFTYDIEIPKVEFGKEQTTLYFDFSHYTTTSFSFRSSTYLVDEEGKRYPIKSCKGFQLDKGYNVKEDGVKEISISFEPLPEGTRVFDCIEGPDLQLSFQFYGIREKGQDWNVFPKKDVADNPFPDSFFGMDTVYVTGRITQSRYDRWGRIEHESNSYSEEALRRQFRLGGGAFDRFYVAKDGTFSFKTLVVKPTMDELNINGGIIPILLIPGDHLQVDISHWGEYNQQVNIRSEKGDYSRMLTNYPFVWEKEIANPRGTLSWSETGKLAANTWQPLHDELEKQMEVCRYLAAKHHFTPTEQKLMQMNVQIEKAFIAYMRMLSPLHIKYRKGYDLYAKANYDNRKLPPRRFSVEDLEADSIFLDLSFIKDCPWDDPTFSATKYYESLLSKLRSLFYYIMFIPGTEKPSRENDSINIYAAAEQLGIREALIGEYLTNYMYSRMVNNPKLRQKVEGIVDDFKSPHTKVLANPSLMVALNEYDTRSYPANQSIAADVIKKLYAPYKGKKVLLLPLSCYKPDGLQKIDSLYQTRRAEIDREAVFLPVATAKFTSKQELKELQQKYPTLKNTVYLDEEELLRLYVAFQRGNGPQADPEMLILQDGTFGIPGRYFLDNYRKKP
jgi:hypothetical protein